MPVSNEELMALLTPVVAQSGADLEAVTVRRAGKRSVIVVTVDRDGGVELDAVADISRGISAALDEVEVMGQSPYVLEVGSPGVDRPLTQERHWRRAKGRLVKVVKSDGSTLTGRVIGASADSATVSSSDEDGEETVISYSEVAKAVVQVEFRSVEGDE
jgi:ribosome maturation factor RimP